MKMKQPSEDSELQPNETLLGSLGWVEFGSTAECQGK